MPRCAVCGQDNPGGFRFCGACGASLAGPARAPAEERRLVTVLFCDLVGFTARSDQADPEDVGALLRPYHARFRAEIERLGGTLDKFIGDGVMAVFGAPVAHEDDPERAVRCALGMLTAIEELNLAHRVVRLVTVVGEPGVGKSRFVTELAASIDDRPELVAWRQGRCLPYGDGITFWALGEIVKAQAGILESDPSAEVAAKLEAAVADLLALILATARPELLERQPGWGGGNRTSTRIPLGALTDLEVARLVAALVGRAALPVGVQALLLERAAGNPLYAEEFARLLADQGLVVEGEVAAAPDIPVPETVHGLIAARLDALTPEVRALVQDAAVVGRVFWPGAVAAMDGSRAAGADASAGPGTAGPALLHRLAGLQRQPPTHRAPNSSVPHHDEN